MGKSRQRLRSQRPVSQWLPPFVITGVWASVLLFLFSTQGLAAIVPVLVIAAALAATLIIQRLDERQRWSRPVQHLVNRLSAMSEDSSQSLEMLSPLSGLDALVQAISELRRSWVEATRLGASAAYYREMIAGGQIQNEPQKPNTSMTRSGLLATIPHTNAQGFDAGLSVDYSTIDMVSRLEPSTLRWLESSRPEQEFLGWDLEALRQKSFLSVVHPDDHSRVAEQVSAALEKGEAHGLVVRIRTADGKPKAIEVSIGARYGPDRSVTHLRCHLTDVTDKIRSERELKLRTRELTQVNEQLRQINRELEELKDRYRDLYQNAPAMYYSLEPDGRLLDCNETLLNTLGYPRDALVAQPIARIIAESDRAHFATKYAEARRKGSIEIESKWIKASGDLIDVWVSATAVRGRDGKFLHTRSVAQDVTARYRLEAELNEKNESLARTIEELSSKNHEMDEFTYVVSHDLQEPLRTLIAFSDFLLKDYGERLDANGQEYVRYLVDASRRLRALIQGLLHLSRAGKVTGTFEAVNLEELLPVVKADLGELVRSRGAEIRTSGSLPTVWGDRDRLSQLIANLVVNGLKYNQSPQPWVELGTLSHEPGSWATLYVRDNGIGIDPQFHTRIFQLFRRLHTQEEYEGTGAGLAICQKIAQAHGGRLWVESAPNEGATFFVSLRCCPDDVEATTPSTRSPHAP